MSLVKWGQTGCLLFSVLSLCVLARAENFASNSSPLPDAPSHSRPFWTVENKIDFGLLGALTTVDAITTQRGLHEGFREINPVMRPFVSRGAAGETVGSALGLGAGLGTLYLLHQTHHFKAERVAMRLMVGVEAAVVTSNLVQLR